MPHVQDVMVVEVAAEVEAASLGDGKVARVEVQLGPGVQALADTPAIFLAERFAAELSGRSDIDDIVSQRPIDVLLHHQAVLLEEARVREVGEEGQ